MVPGNRAARVRCMTPDAGRALFFSTKVSVSAGSFFTLAKSLQLLAFSESADSLDERELVVIEIQLLEPSQSLQVLNDFDEVLSQA